MSEELTGRRCIGPDCDRPPRGAGDLCNGHRQQRAKGQDLRPLGTFRRATQPAVEECAELELVALSAFPGYGIHCDGSVWAVGTNWRGYGARHLTPVEMRGYLNVRMNVAGKRLRVPVHRLVCRAFHGEPQPGQQVRHLNGDPFDNRAVNLAWGTPRENAADRDDHGRSVRGERVVQHKLTASQVDDIRRRAAAGERQRALAAEFGVSETTVSAVVLRKWWKHL